MKISLFLFTCITENTYIFRRRMMLYPQMTQTRMRFSLDGIWDFKLLGADDSKDAKEPAIVPVDTAIAMIKEMGVQMPKSLILR